MRLREAEERLMNFESGMVVKQIQKKRMMMKEMKRRRATTRKMGIQWVMMTTSPVWTPGLKCQIIVRTDNVCELYKKLKICYSLL